jgi:hypothetical protein
MDMNEYALEVLARDRLAELRANAQRAKESRWGRRSSRPLRAAIGHALIRMGRRLQGTRRYSWVGHAAK